MNKTILKWVSFVLIFNSAFLTAFIAYCVFICDFAIWFKILLIPAELASATLTAVLAFMMVDIDLIDIAKRFLQKYFVKK